MSKKRDSFFDSPKLHSIVKSDIVSEYFGAWATIMKYQKHCEELTYLDLFSGPGQYEDGKPSTPIKIFDVVEAKNLHSIFKAHFYEKDNGYRAKLNKVLKDHPAFNKLKIIPEIPDKEISTEMISELPVNDCTLSFVDPHGYDVPAKLLAALVRNWGSDCIFYLTTSGIRRNIENSSEEEDMIDLFGEKGLKELRDFFKKQASWFQRDRMILKSLASRIREIKGDPLYFLPFGMEFEDRKLISYYLILITKHHLGFAIMKDIMSKEERCVLDPDGIPLYYYSKIEREKGTQLKLHLEKHSNRMGILRERLRNDFSKRKISVKDLVESCHKKRYFETSSNVIEALLMLEELGIVKVDRPREKRMRGGKPTLGPSRIVEFL